MILIVNEAFSCSVRQLISASLPLAAGEKEQVRARRRENKGLPDVHEDVAFSSNRLFSSSSSRTLSRATSSLLGTSSAESCAPWR